MKTYFVHWTIVLSAKNHAHAARQALEIMQDKKSTALVFRIKAESERKYRDIDLWKGERKEIPA